MAGPWEKFAQPAPQAGPWNQYVVASTPGTGPKPPAGYSSPDNVQPLVATPGGPNDPRQAAAMAAAEAGARARATTPIEVGGQIAAARAKAQIEAANALKLQQQKQVMDFAQQQKMNQQGTLTGEARNLALQKIKALQGLYGRLQSSAHEFDASQNGSGPLKSVGEFMPGLFSPKNARYDATVDALKLLAKPAFRTPGSGSDSDKESDTFLKALPSRYASDAGNIERYRQLAEIVKGAVQGQRQVLGLKGGAPAQAAKPRAAASPKVIDFNHLPE